MWIRLPSLFVLGFSLWLLTGSASSQQQDATKAVPTSQAATASGAIVAQTTQDPTEAIRYEREVLERQADRQANSLVTIAQWALGGLSALLVVGGGLFFWMFGSTRKELRESLEEYSKKEMRALIEERAQSVRERINAIEEELNSFRKNQLAVTWVVRDEEEAGSELVSMLQQRSIELSAVIPQTGTAFNLGDPSLVIVSYLVTEEGTRRINEVIRQLRNRSGQIPIVVYTFDPARNQNRITPEHATLLDEYKWYVPANFPLQLVTQVTSLATRMEQRV
jgi:hypothetical protein